MNYISSGYWAATIIRPSRRILPAHYLIGDVIGFLFVGVVRLADFEFGLNKFDRSRDCRARAGVDAADDLEAETRPRVEPNAY